VRIGAMVEQRCGLKEDPQSAREKNEDEEDRDEEEGFKNDSGESQEEVEKGVLSLTSC